MSYLFTSESVSEGHPDKVADQISDALLDEFLAYDKNSKVACETLVTTGQVVLAGEVKSSAYVDVQDVARNVIEKIGYTKSEYQFEAKSCGVFSSIHEQSGDINRGVEREDPYNQGAGDQGMMFGYATNETENYMPLALDLSHSLLWELAEIRKNENDLMPYLRPDAKSQVTIEYDDNGKPLRIDTIVVSTQHDEFITAKGITQEELAARLNVVRQTVSKWEKGLSVPDSELLIKLAEILEVPVSRLLGSKIEEEEQPDDLAEQLSRINEQLAIKNRRARRVWKAIAFIVDGVIAVYVLILILATVFSFSPDQSGTTAGSSQSVETIVEKG